jgi:hypothetical protein
VYQRHRVKPEAGAGHRQPAGDVLDRGRDDQAVLRLGGGRRRVSLLAEYPDETESGQVAGQRLRP